MPNCGHAQRASAAPEHRAAEGESGAKTRNTAQASAQGGAKTRSDHAELRGRSVASGSAARRLLRIVEPKPFRVSIVPGGVHGGDGAIFAEENPIFQSKNRFLAVSAPENPQDFSGNWRGAHEGRRLWRKQAVVSPMSKGGPLVRFAHDAERPLRIEDGSGGGRTKRAPSGRSSAK